jgi:hypothetical protein
MNKIILKVKLLFIKTDITLEYKGKIFPSLYSNIKMTGSSVRPLNEGV